MEDKDKEFKGGKFSSSNERPVRTMLSELGYIGTAFSYARDDELLAIHREAFELWEKYKGSNLASADNLFATLTRLSEYALREARRPGYKEEPDDEGESDIIPEIEHSVLMTPDQLTLKQIADQGFESDGNDFIDLTDPDFPYLIAGLKGAGPPYIYYAEYLEEAKAAGRTDAHSFEMTAYSHHNR